MARILRRTRRRLAGRQRLKPKDGWGGGVFAGIPRTAGATGGAAMSLVCSTEGLLSSRVGFPRKVCLYRNAKTKDLPRVPSRPGPEDADPTAVPSLVRWRYLYGFALINDILLKESGYNSYST